MVSKQIINVLKFIVKELRMHEINWVLVGSISLALQGMDVEPKDIDILTAKEDALRLNRIWERYKVRDVAFRESSIFKSYYGKFMINGIEVEVMGDLEEKRGYEWISLKNRLEKPIIVSIEGTEIPVTPLVNQLLSYEKSSRDKDRILAERIRRMLSIIQERNKNES